MQVVLYSITQISVRVCCVNVEAGILPFHCAHDCEKMSVESDLIGCFRCFKFL